MSLFGAPTSLPSTPAPAGCYAQVALERGVERAGGEGTLTYRVPETLVPKARAGARVRAPLGRGNALVAGWIVRVGGAELAQGIDARKLRPLADVGEHDPLPAHLIELARWIASYYICPLGMALAGMVPAAAKARTGLATIATAKLASPLPAPEVLAGVLRTKRQRAVWELLLASPAARSAVPLHELATLLGLASPTALRRLASAGLLTLGSTTGERAAPRENDAPTAMPLPSSPAPLPTLAPFQRAVVEGITPKLDRFGVHLLRGVTGSGKTEVYLRLLERTLAQGRRAIVLVPEIALTPQTTRRFVDRFGAGTVAVLHSGLTGAQRSQAWRRLALGEARVAIGARSAIFAPLTEVGLIVVDEEHDASYKQDQLPRYNARDVAIKRGQLEGACVVLGSATPSLESWANATGTHAHWHLWTMDQRVGGAALPAVAIIDMRQEQALRRADPRLEPRRRHLLGPTLEARLEQTLHAGEQAMLVLNRRGLAHYLACPKEQCGYLASCVDCDAALVLHKDATAPDGTIVRCHHCLREQRVPRLCPTCGGPLTSQGGGTQKLEEEVERKFASLGLRAGETMLRLDSDTMRTARNYFDALARFARGEVRLLLGTQMIAKGLDFPGVTLVGIVDADTGLNIPDFRAEERTFQLISQSAGRAGRGSLPGLVLVQTFSPTLGVLAHAARHDYVAFALEQLAQRREHGLPPARRMARVVCRDEDADKARQRAERLSAELAHAASGLEGVIVGPALPCTIARLAGQHRFAIELLAPQAGVLHRVLSAVRHAGLLTSDAHTAVDVDPLALL